MTPKHKIAFVSRLIYPDPAANALQTTKMAAALSQRSDTRLFVYGLNEPEKQIRSRYAIDESPLQISSLHAARWPSALYDNAWARSVTYNSGIAGILALQPEWWNSMGRRNVLFVRSRLEFLYWGLARPYLKWLRNWIFVYEAHELDRDREQDHRKSSVTRLERTRRALGNFDLVTCISSALAADVESFTDGSVRPRVLTLCSGLPRLSAPPMRLLKSSSNTVVLGYIGTVDQPRGVDCVLNALRFLPDRFRLQVVGRIAGADGGRRPPWLSNLLSDPAIAAKVEFNPQVPYSSVAANIDSCDILIQPAGRHLPFSRYATPLKLFDYMARGKPIVAAGVPNHLEFLQDGINARIYKESDPRHLAACIIDLAENPQQAQTIARAAWEQSRANTYATRAGRMLELIDETWDRVYARG